MQRRWLTWVIGSNLVVKRKSTGDTFSTKLYLSLLISQCQNTDISVPPWINVMITYSDSSWKDHSLKYQLATSKNRPTERKLVYVSIFPRCALQSASRKLTQSMTWHWPGRVKVLWIPTITVSQLSFLSGWRPKSSKSARNLRILPAKHLCLFSALFATIWVKFAWQRSQGQQLSLACSGPKKLLT